MTIDPAVRIQIILGAVNAATARLVALTAQAAGDRRPWTGSPTWMR